MTAYGLEGEPTVRLEKALENERYVMHFPTCEEFEMDFGIAGRANGLKRLGVDEGLSSRIRVCSAFEAP